MAETPQPEFPALLVESDGSLELLTSNTEWSDDVDHWYWSSPDAYLIDQQLRRFEPDAERSTDGRPHEVPDWRFSTILEVRAIERLIQDNPDGYDRDSDISSFLRSQSGT